MIRKQLVELLSLTEEDLTHTVILKKHPKHEDLLFLLLNKKANTFTHDFVREIHSNLDIVESNVGRTLLIVTSLHPNIFSGGLDLNFLLVLNYFSIKKPLSTYDHSNFILEFIRLLGRMLRLNVPSIAMLNGHAIAGGCMLALSCDWRTSRSEPEKVKMALTEIEIAMYLPPGMNAVC
jgi:enoyl-CoA hydratase